MYVDIIICRHEIVGIVTEVGSKVEKFKVGETVEVGCLVGSCRSCQSCDNNLEQYWPKLILTYAFPYFDGTITYGGYSDHFATRFWSTIVMCWVLDLSQVFIIDIPGSMYKQEWQEMIHLFINITVGYIVQRDTLSKHYIVSYIY